ncbi:hypothetical protein [Ramlibacter sp.]|uniref:hypothetical protein n=1 Tax=Ramlibacter sp. TaxID=1917967 RepID=UPI003D0BBDD8
MSSLEPEGVPLELRSSEALARLPAVVTAAAPVSPVTVTAPAAVSAVDTAMPQSARPVTSVAGNVAGHAAKTGEAAASVGAGTAAVVAGGMALLALTGWLIERRRRRSLEVEKDSLLWADVQPPATSIITSMGNIDDILPDSPNPAEAARAIYVTAIGETNSRREATLIDLQQLRHKLRRRNERGDHVSAVLQLQQHLVDFRYTSPWVFLELRELYLRLGREAEWEVARESFRKRFGQNAPAWAAPSSADAALIDDEDLTDALVPLWPYREARLFVMHWMLGEHEMRQRCSGPPLLPLGVYRDLMMVDAVLDEVMDLRTQPADSLL